MKKFLLITAFILTFSGIALLIYAISSNGFNFPNNENYSQSTYAVSEEFNNIKINSGEDDVVFKPSKTASVVCFDSEKIKHIVSAENGTLNIDYDDMRKWYDYLIPSKSRIITVYLPLSQYDTIDIKVSTGDINIKDITCKDLNSSGSTGSITLENVLASDTLNIKSSTGDVRFINSDAGEITVKTSTGDVTGTLKSGKEFITKTSTGDISVPDTKFGGKCTVTTSTGDIYIDIFND